MALFQLASISAMQMHTEIVADIAMNAVLSEYHKELRSRYGLLMVDTSYGSGAPGIANVNERLRYYVQGNLTRTDIGKALSEVRYNSLSLVESSIPEYSFATDGDGAVFRRQILAYMTVEPVENLFASAASNVEELESRGYSTRDIQEEERANQEIIDSIEIPPRINENGEEEEVTLQNPADEINSRRGSVLTELAVPSGMTVSGARINPAEYASHRSHLQGTGLYDTEALSYTEKLLLDQYMFEKCGNVRSPKADTQLQYELEYILYGCASDRENLESVLQTLLFWREASNFTYIMTDAEKVAIADGLALAAALAVLQPELQEPVKMSILFAWSFAESIYDLKTLLRGGRVPLVKSKDTWNTHLWNMVGFGNNGSDGGSGLSYEEYLRMMFLMHDTKEKTSRLMDIMEMNIRRTPGNAAFRMDGCLDCFRGRLLTQGRFGFSMDIQRYYGYEQLQ